MINGFKQGIPSSFSTSTLVTKSLSGNGLKSSKNRKSKLENPRIQQIAVTLFAYKRLVDSEKAFA
jgi:hypothetical protein